MSKNTKVVVPGRFSFVNVWEPKASMAVSLSTAFR